MRFELSSLPRNCSAEDIIAEIKRVDSLVGKDSLTAEDYNRFSKMSSSGVRRRFGGWQKALIAAGLGHKYSGAKISEKMQQQSKLLSNEQILSELKRIATKLNKDSLKQEDVSNYSKIISVSTIGYRFGSWAKGLEKAGLKVSDGYRRKFAEKEYFENLLNVWSHYGRQPSYNEMTKFPSVISPKTYESHFGTWRKALEAFVLKMNQDDGEEKQDESSPTLDTPEGEIMEERRWSVVLTDDKRQISLGLRYKVLNRDKFKCVKCGASPATDLDCRLHIDHIIPFSRGGRTTFDNLQTLCEKCNLGKADTYIV